MKIINMSQRRNFVIKICIDIISLILVLLPWIVLHFVEPYKRGFFCSDNSIKYPYKDSTIPSTVVNVLGIALPTLTILITEAIHMRRGSKTYDVEALSNRPVGLTWKPYLVTCYFILLAFAFGCAIVQSATDIGKYSIGRLRPHFFAICQPDWEKVRCRGSNNLTRYVVEDVCTGTDQRRLEEMRLSFPSGHTSMCTYCMVFLVLYLQAQFRWKKFKLLRPVLQVICLWMALMTGVSRICDYKHHWSDVVGGAFLGAFVAILTGMYVSNLCRDPGLNQVMTNLYDIKRCQENVPEMDTDETHFQNDQKDF